MTSLYVTRKTVVSNGGVFGEKGVVDDVSELTEFFHPISVIVFMTEAAEAEWLAIQLVESRQPSGCLPAWFLRSAVNSKHKRADGIWVVQMGVFTKRVLEEGEYWKVINGSRMVASRHPENGEELIELFGWGNQKRITVFVVEVHLHEQRAFMLRSVNLADLDLSNIECNEG
ncbi:MAG TPA: hypothetical protein VGE39_23610 [Prosthecobacter sp.]